MKKIKTIVDFEKLLQDHDWFYAFSDDTRYYKAGRMSEEKLITLTENNRAWRDLFLLYSQYNSAAQTMTEPEFLAKRKTLMEDYLASIGN